MKIKVGSIALICLFTLLSQAQTINQSCYWIQLKDKNGSLYTTAHPEQFLSQRAIQRRVRQHIAIDDTDLPVSEVYLDTLKKRNLEIVHTSKWLNGVTVRTGDTALIRKISALAFVTRIQLTKPGTALKSASSKFSSEVINAYDPSRYGEALTQLTQLNGQYLHQQGFRGKGIWVALLDAGFLNVDKIAAFDSLRNSGRILGTRDFVNPRSNLYEQNYHGMSVLSCMGGNIPGSLIGTAPDASYFLFRTEDDATEYLVEEDNWVAAAEYADSLGVDVINSSLGYSQFNDPGMNHSYEDMDGKTTRVTRGANMAFKKGILVFSSAGNEGNKPWTYIIAPSDGENVIAVAAIDKTGSRAAFSSVGPAYGGAVKPNLAAMGSGDVLVTSSQTLGYANGTSFSSPVLAGMGACLLQANPYCPAKQIKLAIEQSASQYAKPDTLLGYGIPDFEKADKYLKVNSALSLTVSTNWNVFPNPFSSVIYLKNTGIAPTKSTFVSIYTIQGTCIWQSIFSSGETIILNNLANLPQGVLVMKIRSGENEERFKLIKTNAR